MKTRNDESFLPLIFIVLIFLAALIVGYSAYSSVSQAMACLERDVASERERAEAL